MSSAFNYPSMGSSAASAYPYDPSAATSQLMTANYLTAGLTNYLGTYGQSAVGQSAVGAANALTGSASSSAASALNAAVGSAAVAGVGSVGAPGSVETRDTSKLSAIEWGHDS